MNEQEGITGWIIGAIGVVVSALTGTVTMFYKQQIKDYRDLISELKTETVSVRKRAIDCETERGDLKVKYAVLEQRVSDLEASKVDHETLNRKLKGNP